MTVHFSVQCEDVPEEDERTRYRGMFGSSAPTMDSLHGQVSPLEGGKMHRRSPIRPPSKRWSPFVCSIALSESNTFVERTFTVLVAQYQLIS